ncbi:2-phospho-L-lactate transferase CofD family protein, partial [Nitratidesulfovibrio liaohensis]|uniref:2-phospho-L-lactate transferase CofD family protein n=1 Tax=Nitratidesulfovibrio liaohensis TaxID=2604158 RepID=UPI001FB8F213
MTGDAVHGPRIVFFTGGTALKSLSHALTGRTHNSAHLVTPFDSGGSTAVLRRYIRMPAVGDLRNRLLALADPAVATPPLVALCDLRLADAGEHDTLMQRLYALASDRDPAWRGIDSLVADVLRLHLRWFLEFAPPGFDPHGACLGNLLLAGGYLRHGGGLGPVLHLFTRLLQVRGTVVPIVDDDLHLAAELTDGTVLLGQHRITGKGVPGITVPVRRLFLTRTRPDGDGQGEDGGPNGLAGQARRAGHDGLVGQHVAGGEKRHGADGGNSATPAEARVPVSGVAARLIAEADLICFPMGSFYTSVLANLLPEGVGSAVAAAPCPKVYVPNSGTDPEQLGLSVADCAAALLTMLRRDAGAQVPAARLLNTVVVDTRNGVYPGGVDHEGLRAQGVNVLDAPVVRALPGGG